MPFSLERLPDEPIMIAKLWGEITPEDIAALYVQSADIIKAVGGHVWRISDHTETIVTQDLFMRMLNIIRLAARGLPGSPTDPNLSLTLVHRNDATQLFREFMAQPQFGGVQIPIMFSLDDALESIYFQIAQWEKGNPIN